MKPPKGRKDDAYWDRWNERMYEALWKNPRLKPIFERFKEQQLEGDIVRRTP